VLDPLWTPIPAGAGKAALRPPVPGAGLLPASLWRVAQVAAAPDLNGATAPGAWAGLPWFVPGPVAGVPYYA